jgi:hypothetical protein
MLESFQNSYHWFESYRMSNKNTGVKTIYKMQIYKSSYSKITRHKDEKIWMAPISKKTYWILRNWFDFDINSYSE